MVRKFGYRLARSARFLLLALSCAVCDVASAAPAGSNQTAFATLEDAATALINAVRSGEASSVSAVLGPQGQDIASSGDPVADAAMRANFAAAFDEAHEVKQEDATSAVLVVGKDKYPFPVPLVNVDGKWRWDTPAGLDAILTRRIGENELDTIEVMRAYVVAQQEYAEADRDGLGLQYARRLMSTKGKKDGLYWPASGEETLSPLGPLIANARAEGYKKPNPSGEPRTYHGYIYRILYAQGSNAPGGARDYIVNDRMIGGFALIATPAEYANSGVMSFIVNQDGDVYQKDLGPDTNRVAARIKSYDPDSTWVKIAAP